jgi:hypothetical protein
MEKTMREIVMEEIEASGKTVSSYLNNMSQHYLPDGSSPFYSYRDNLECRAERKPESKILERTYRESLEASKSEQWKFDRHSELRLGQNFHEFYALLDEVVEPTIGISAEDYKRKVHEWRVENSLTSVGKDQTVNELLELHIVLREKGYRKSDLTA